MKNETYLGVDIGLSGALSLVNNRGTLMYCVPIPTLEATVNDKRRKQYYIQGVIRIIKDWANDEFILRACIERLRPIPKQASQVGFSLGGGAMLFKTIFTFLNIPFIEVEPHAWQKKIFGELGIQYTTKTTKEASVKAASQLFPGCDFRPSERCKKDSSDFTDSACIALYNLKTYNK